MVDRNKKLKISRVESQKRPGRYNIYINEQYAFPVSEEVLLKYMMFKGSEFTVAEIENIKSADDISKLYNKAVDFISYRQRSTAEVKQKLLTLSENENSINNVIRRLKEIDLINDENYAKNYINQVVSLHSKGPRAASRYLEQKGINEEIIQKMLKELYPQDKIEHNASIIAQKLFDHYSRYPYNKRIEKAKKSLLRKGFDFDEIEQALTTIDTSVNQKEQKYLLEKEAKKLTKKYHDKKGYEKKQKIKKSLFRKGFDLDDIDQYLDELEG